MTDPMKKVGGLFGRKIEFKIGASCKRTRSSSGGGQAPTPPPRAHHARPSCKESPPPSHLPAPPPPPPQARHARSSCKDSPPPSHLPAPTSAPAPAPAPPPPPPPQARHALSSCNNSPPPSHLPAPTPAPAPAPPEILPSSVAPSSAKGSPTQLQPPTLQLGRQPSDHHLENLPLLRSPLLSNTEAKREYIDSMKDGMPAPVKLLASKRTYLQPPMEQRVLSDITSLGCQEEVSDEDYKGCNEYQTNTLEDIAQESAVSLEFLAGSRTCVHAPIDPQVQCPFSPPKPLGWQTKPEVTKSKSDTKDVGSSKQRDDSASHSLDNSTKCWCIHTKGMQRLDQFLHKRELTKTIELPGTSTSCRLKNAASMETRLILRSSIRSLYKLHREGYSLDGSFGLNNFWIDDSLFITLGYRAEDRKEYTKGTGLADLKRFVGMVEEDVFESEDVPYEIGRWLSLIQRAGTDCEYLVSYDCALMEHNQVLSTFLQLYSKLRIMETSDRVGHKFVLDHLQHFAGWKVYDLHNRYFIDTYWKRDPGTSMVTEYGTDVKSLLRLIRNTFQHIMTKTVDINGRVTFGEEEYEYMLTDQFPGLLSDFMEAMYIATYLADLNLEHVMV